MKILGIESSCDETAAAVVENTSDGGIRILSNITATSSGLHAKTGGVIPEDAARKQIESIIPVIDLALHDAFPSPTESRKLIANIDAIAITVGPGLIGSLLVGVETAKTLAMVTGKPIIPINHLVAHIYANFVVENPKFSVKGGANALFQITKGLPQFPALALVVSGGHTDLVLMKDHENFEWIGGTRDDAAGEAFDKTARLLGFDYPGGPLLSKAADEYLSQFLNPKSEVLNLFPRPLIHEPNYDWSFSGLKTAVLREMKHLVGEKQDFKMSDYPKISKIPKVLKEKNRLAAEIQEAIVDCLVFKVLRAIEEYKPKSFLLAGGVSANGRLREKFENEIEKMSKDKPIFFAPKPILCTDNAVAIAACAYFNQKQIDWKKVNANPELTIMDKI